MKKSLRYRRAVAVFGTMVSLAFTTPVYAATTIASDQITLSGAPTASATASMITLSGALSGGSASGTYLGLNAATAYAGDFLNFQQNGVSLFRFSAVASAVNGLQFTAAATAAGPNVGITAIGSDANIDIQLAPKGASGITINSTSPGISSLNTSGAASRSIFVTSGNVMSGVFASGSVNILTGTTADGNTGEISLIPSNATGTNRTGGPITLTAGNSTGNVQGGLVIITGGVGGGTDATGGSVTLVGGAGGATNGAGGDVILRGGALTGVGTDGIVMIGTDATRTNLNSTAGRDLLFVEGRFEVNGPARFDDLTLFASQRSTAAGTDDATAEWNGKPVVFLNAAGAQTFNLGPCAGNGNSFVRIYIQDTSANDRTINGTNSEGIIPYAGGAKANFIMRNNTTGNVSSATLYCDGTDWFTIARDTR